MRYLLLVGAVALAGCSGEPEPVVGDAPITKGIEKRAPAPRTSSAAAAMQPRKMSPQEYLRLRNGK